MKELISFELQKMLNKKLVLAAFVVMAFLTIIMIHNWIFPGEPIVQAIQNDEIVTLDNQEATRFNQEVAKRYAGPITNQKVQDFFLEYNWTPEQIEKRGLSPDRQSYYYHNFLYSALRSYFTNTDGSYNGTTVEEVYGPLADSLEIGYSESWESTLYCLSYLILIWGCVVVVILSPCFSEEYGRRTDSLILTSTSGRTKCSTAKIIASFLIAIGGCVLIIALGTICMFLYHGSAGFDASVQIGSLSYFSATPYQMTWGTAYAFSCLLWITGIIVLTGVTLLLSAVVHNTFTGLVITFALYAAPLFIPWRSIGLNFLGIFQPIRQVQVIEMFSLDKWKIGSLQLPIMWLTIPIAIVIMLLGIFYSKRCFSHHQVS